MKKKITYAIFCLSYFGLVADSYSQSSEKDIPLIHLLCSNWKLIEEVRPKIGADDKPAGKDTIRYTSETISKEILSIYSNNTYKQNYKNDKDSVIHHENGTWLINENFELKERIIVFSCQNHSGKNAYSPSKWVIKNISDKELVLQFQTRGGVIYKTYISTKL